MLAEGLEAIGLTPAGEDGFTQRIPQIGATNVIGAIRGASDRWIVLGAHYDACGWDNPGASDNAAGVAIALEVAERLQVKVLEHSVLVVLFDAEEPPNFLTPLMGSQWFVDHPTIPMDRVDTMVCLDVVGHSLGPEALPPSIRDSVFVLGAEKGSNTPTIFDSLPQVDGIIPRRIDNYVVPSMSDYDAFNSRSIPFLFYTCGRNSDYHMPTDTPEKLDYGKMAALVDHLTSLIVELAARPHPPKYLPEGVDDTGTLRTLVALADALRPHLTEVAQVDLLLEELSETLDQHGVLSPEHRRQISHLIFQIEEALA